MSEAASETAIKALVSAMMAAWGARDLDGYMACFTEDVEFTNVFGVRMNRAETTRTHAVIFKKMFASSVTTATETHVRVLRPDLAAVDIRWEMTGSRDAAGKDWPTRQGLMNTIAVETPKGWRFAVFHNQDLPPPERVAEFRQMMAREG
jgi:uncharacterized protein (TIGR02246 family)